MTDSKEGSQERAENHSEATLFLTALMFYTRLPVTKNLPYSTDLLNRSRKYFTSIGLVVGGLVCCSFLLAQAVFPMSVAVALSIVISILLTGAFHEDGFADSCDALGGGWKPEQILTIMKDSRIGTYGTVALICILGLKFIVLLEIANIGVWLWCACVLAAHTVSRYQSSRVIAHHQYVQDIDKSKIKPIADAPLDKTAERFSLVVGLLPCTLLAIESVGAVIAGVGLAYFSANAFMSYCARRVGGYTGDILGAIQQLSEIVFLLSCLALLY